MADPARKLATYDDLFTIPEHHVGEILGGELIAHPRPGFRHSRAATKIVGQVEYPFGGGRGGPGGWVILIEPELHLGADVLVPDLAGWHEERLPSLEIHASEIAPDWVCEVLSPSTAKIDRGRKMPIYAREGVRHVWLVDPAIHTLELFELRRVEQAEDASKSAQYALLHVAGDDETGRYAPFEAIEFELASLWTPTSADPAG